jgi:GntR family transcriptional repressor for pyruvate dehydrogenase complex
MDTKINFGAQGWTPLPQVVARQLQQLILKGEWKAGEKIPSQRMLSEEYAVSRASLREALLTLETLGLIRTEPGRGTFVAYGLTPTSGKDSKWRFADMFSLHDVFETRVMLEGRIAQAAAGRIDEAGIAALSKATDQMERFWDGGDLLANVEADLQFHRSIAASCGNQMLKSMYAAVSNFLTETQRQPIPKTETTRMRGSVAEHRKLIDALRKSDGEAARLAMETHVRNTARCAGVTVR